jgi:dTDP-4-dehydrorhamnose reductase
MQSSESDAAPPLELWGGIECTVNRVQDAWFDQLARGGHERRIDDLDLIAALGVRTLRFPLVWERTAPGALDAIDWRWADERMERLRALGVEPIVGLLHHGSGPSHTNLLDPEFPAKLAAYARLVARRYPWVERWTPINEPLTTARFALLYGYWYPHECDALAFLRGQLNQCAAIRAAMRAIRETIPDAQLVQTEDLGKTHATPRLDHQAEFENERRWLTFDLLTGRLGADHPLRPYLHHVGIRDAELAPFVDDPCPPALLGINHYLTSERFLDERVSRYPRESRGGNGRDIYADVEAVRVLAHGPVGPRALLGEAWRRYRQPLAITEAHLGCTREQQLRWLAHVWRCAHAAREDGCDVRAVTAWSMLGAWNWRSLLTRDEGHYEPGAFDVRSSVPRATALARLVAELARGEEPSHPTAAAPGWWETEQRLLYPPVEDAVPRGWHLDGRAPHVRRSAERRARPLLIVGATGTFGRAVARLCEERGLAHVALPRVAFDLTEPRTFADRLDSLRPWAVVNAGGYVRVDDAERDAQRCHAVNADGPGALAAACAARGIALLALSSDLVFDGRAGRAYLECDEPAPLNVYGASKARMERLVLDAHPAALVARASAFFGPWDGYNFAVQALDAFERGERFVAASDATVSPTFVPDLVHVALDLLIDGERGVWHLANRGAVTWVEFARRLASAAGLAADTLEERPLVELALQAPRPRHSALASTMGELMPDLDDAIARFARDWQHARPIAAGREEPDPAGRAPAPSGPAVHDASI